MPSSLSRNASSARFRIGLAANRSHQQGPESALAQLLTGSRSSIEQHLKPQLVVVGRTLDAMQQLGLLENYPHIERFPYGRHGGLMKLVSRVVDADPARTLDAVIYLMDPAGKFAANYDNSQGPEEIAADLKKRL